ncbi:vitamin K epoxide reductase family protein [Candidatus Peregrinibacteria bacterium]|nr:vitamin K epoxide reductase family protein [Candidatus Peregrinibacteria bacterium]
MTIHALLFTLAAIGLSETSYLIKKRKADSAPHCFIGGSCQVVLESKYNKIFGIHNDILGFFFYFVLSLILGLIVVGIEPLQVLDMLARASIFSAAIFSIVLVYLQKFVIKAWCFWCLLSAITIWLMTLIILLTNLV